MSAAQATAAKCARQAAAAASAPALLAAACRLCRCQRLRPSERGPGHGGHVRTLCIWVSARQGGAAMASPPVLLIMRAVCVQSVCMCVQQLGPPAQPAQPQASRTPPKPLARSHRPRGSIDPRRNITFISHLAACAPVRACANVCVHQQLRKTPLSTPCGASRASLRSLQPPCMPPALACVSSARVCACVRAGLRRPAAHAALLHQHPSSSFQIARLIRSHKYRTPPIAARRTRTGLSQVAQDLHVHRRPAAPFLARLE